MAKAIFCYDEDKLYRVLDKWAEAQRKKNPELLDGHLDYMKGSVLAFMLSGESKELRMTSVEDALDQLGDIEHAPEIAIGNGLSQDKES